MPVAPDSAPVRQDCTPLFQWLVSRLQGAAATQAIGQRVAVALELGPVDPLAVLQAIAPATAPHWYLEHPAAHMAIAAFGDVETCCVPGRGGPTRFAAIQRFATAAAPLLLSQGRCPAPRVFCRFTFFNEGDGGERDGGFAAAEAVLPAWQIIRQGNQGWAIATVTLPIPAHLPRLTEQIWQQYCRIRAIAPGIVRLPHGRSPATWRWADVNDFRATVATALPALRHHGLEKLVLSHAVDAESPFPFDWLQSLDNLRQIHPDCFVFSTRNGQGQTFLGASPELLLRVRNRRLMTDALAGSAPRGASQQEDATLGDRLLNSAKERHEHQLVVDFLRDRLQQLNITPESAAQPQLLKLSNIQHLHTPIWGTIPAHCHPLEILAMLHPTPAVAGMPRDRACALIRRYEPFGRSLYAAPLGWVDSDGNAEFIVGIRSALINGCHARLFAGAGIVAGSDPDRELAEVKLKLQALLKALV
ncbi:MAG: isochorismate synthase [Kaiparowitsia implicata GSE-PSE-MK54-09C]|jgi:menaquinone-specific isochorismate synthase|nr:isochorismate synthase [Kaiparowitsia implicata GSE-PSE-MK54-09C]